MGCVRHIEDTCVDMMMMGCNNCRLWQPDSVVEQIENKMVEKACKAFCKWCGLSSFQGECEKCDRLETFKNILKGEQYETTSSKEDSQL